MLVRILVACTKGKKKKKQWGKGVLLVALAPVREQVQFLMHLFKATRPKGD